MYEAESKIDISPKNSQNVASPPDQDFPDTVLLFEPRISHPALRVTLTKKIFKIKRRFGKFIKKTCKKFEKTIFFTFSIFFENCAYLCLDFRPR